MVVCFVGEEARIIGGTRPRAVRIDGSMGCSNCYFFLEMADRCLFIKREEMSYRSTVIFRKSALAPTEVSYKEE